jgi:hypothetical protein
MNDFIKIDKKLSIYFKDIKPDLLEDGQWQTLFLGSWLCDYIITKNALLKDNFDGTFNDVNFHGIIHLYSQNEQIKQEFKAKYTDGKLINILEVENHEDKHWSKY